MHLLHTVQMSLSSQGVLSTQSRYIFLVSHWDEPSLARFWKVVSTTNIYVLDKNSYVFLYFNYVNLKYLGFYF